jgi:hypothetical protein
VSHARRAVSVGFQKISWGSREKGVEDPCHNDVVQSSPKDEQISDVREDVTIQGVATKREMHEITPPLVVARRGFQNGRDH